MTAGVAGDGFPLAVQVSGRDDGPLPLLHERGRHGFFDEFADDIVPVIDDFLDGEDGR